MFTREEMLRLHDEIARVAKLQAEGRAAADKARRERDERRKEAEAHIAAVWRERRKSEAKQQARQQAEAKEYWAKREARAAKRAAKAAAKTEHSYARERRSRIDWLEITGERTIANRQMYWERRATALAMHKAGLSAAEIGKRLDVCRARAHQMIDQAKREHGKRSPGEVWMGDMKINPDMRRWQAVAAVNALQVMPKHDPEADWIWMGLAA